MKGRLKTSLISWFRVFLEIHPKRRYGDASIEGWCLDGAQSDFKGISDLKYNKKCIRDKQDNGKTKALKRARPSIRSSENGKSNPARGILRRK